MGCSKSTCLAIALVVTMLVTVACGDSSSKPMVEVKSPKGRVLLQEVQLTDRFPLGCNEKDANCTVFKSGRELIIWVQFFGDVKAIDLQGAYVTDGSGSRTNLTGNGLDMGRMFISFHVPSDARNFTFHWLDNPPVPLGK